MIRASGNISSRKRSLPKPQKAIHITMMQPENRIKSRNTGISHIPSNIAMYLIVNALQTRQCPAGINPLPPSMTCKLAPWIRFKQGLREKINNPLFEIILILSEVVGCDVVLGDGVVSRTENRGTICCGPGCVCSAPEGRVDGVESVSKKGVCLGCYTAIGSEDLDRWGSEFIWDLREEGPIEVRKTPSLRFLEEARIHRWVGFVWLEDGRELGSKTLFIQCNIRTMPSWKGVHYSSITIRIGMTSMVAVSSPCGVIGDPFNVIPRGIRQSMDSSQSVKIVGENTRNLEVACRMIDVLGKCLERRERLDVDSDQVDILFKVVPFKTDRESVFWITGVISRLNPSDNNRCGHLQ
jgi:hypothetical protein